MKNYFDIAFTPGVEAIQKSKGSRELYDQPLPSETQELDPDEVALINTRDSFYMSTISSSGWPYVQHRGGHIGFVKILGPNTIGWLERPGNRQYIGTGNITENNRVSIIMVDYPQRIRLKLFGHASYHPTPDQALLEQLDNEPIRDDGAITVEVVASQWNCPKYITSRFTVDQLKVVTED